MPIRTTAKRSAPSESKHDKFRRLATTRTQSVVEALRKLSNLSSSNYEFKNPEVKTIFEEIEKAVEKARGHFRRDLKGRVSFTL